jgi:hypothetical protein
LSTVWTAFEKQVLSFLFIRSNRQVQRAKAADRNLHQQFYIYFFYKESREDTSTLSVTRWEGLFVNEGVPPRYSIASATALRWMKCPFAQF